MSVVDRVRTAWNAFMNKDPTSDYNPNYGMSYSYNPDRPRLTRGNERSIITGVYNRIAVDAASIDVLHVKTDEDGRYLKTVNDRLNDCLTLSANIDQSARAFRLDVFLSLLDEGVIGIVPVDTMGNPKETDSYEIESMRVGKILEWYPRHVRMLVYDDRVGKKKERIFPKRMVAICENPFYAIMNEPNSVAQRLIRKLNLLDAIDEQSGAGKLDLIVQLPYSLKNPIRRQQAEERRKDIEVQLSGSKYGIAYTDATEHVTQLNRPVENNLLKQVEYLTSMLYSQLGITQSIMDGTADEKTMTNYYSRTVEPVVSVPVDEMKRTFISKTARTQGHSICFYRDPFKLVSVTEMPDLADKLTRNEIMTGNEVRQKIGLKPSKDPRADELRNKNLSEPKEEVPIEGKQIGDEKKKSLEEENQNG